MLKNAINSIILIKSVFLKMKRNILAGGLDPRQNRKSAGKIPNPSLERSINRKINSCKTSNT
jgi:hypothetical protein